MANDYPIYQYPTGGATDPNVLQASLGSFWNMVFNEKATVTGYCLGLAEELTQTYCQLVDTVNSFGVNNIPILDKERWYPLVVKLSDLNASPLTFQPSGTVFGAQPTTDPFYASAVFQFGGTKSPTQNVWTVDVPATFAEFSVIANRVIAPSVVYVNNVDVTLQESVLYFNTNPFGNPTTPTYPIINPEGIPATFQDSSGNTVQDRFMILWCYHLQEDNQNVTNNFGYLYNLTLPSTQQSAQIMQSLMGLSVGGATPSRLKSLVAAFAGIPVVIEPSETIQNIYQDKFSKLVVTDSHVYRFDLALNFLPTTVVGAVVQTGDVLVDAIQYYDSSVLPRWWEKVFSGWPVVPFSSNIFLGSYQFQLTFSNTLELVTLSADGVLAFPVEGSSKDVATFNAMLNDPANLPAILAGFGLTTSSNPALNKSAVPIIPTQWLFQNFFNDNMALLYVNLPDADVTSQVLTYMELLKPLLPPHVFLMQQVTLNFAVDVYNQLNDCIIIPGLGNVPFNSDGSDSDGFMANEAPYYFKDLPTRLFVVAKAPLKDGEPLTDSSNFDVVNLNAVDSGQALVKAAKVLTHIPTGATTRTVRTLNIMDFS
jgi:hypothetical protein